MSVTSVSRAAEIDPDILRFVEELNSEASRIAGPGPISVARRREVAELARKRWVEGGPKMAETLDRTLPGGQRVRIHIPASGPGNGTLLYLHGGGWVLFSIDTHDRLMREYADRAGCAVVGLDYSLAPEHPFPTQLDEIETCLDWLRGEAGNLGINTDRIALGGDSAGGNLSLCAALRLRDKGLTGPAALLLNYAALDMSIRPSHGLYDGDPFMLGTGEMKAFWDDYLGAGHQTDPYARPLEAELKGLPPTHLCIAICDILADENYELEDRLRAAGVPVSSKAYAGATHSFLEAVSISPLAARALQDGADWLKSVLAA